MDASKPQTLRPSQKSLPPLSISSFSSFASTISLSPPAALHESSPPTSGFSSSIRNSFVWQPHMGPATPPLSSFEVDSAVATTMVTNSPPTNPYRLFTSITSGIGENGDLSKFHYLNEKGKISGDISAIQQLVMKGGDKIKNFRHGTAAVTIRVKEDGEITNYVSGFRLEARAIITCAHFNQSWPDDWAEFKACVDKYQAANTKDTVTASQDSLGFDGSSHEDLLPLELVALHKPGDMAVFRILNVPEDDDENTTIKIHQMCSTSQGEQGLLADVDRTWWSAGFNGPVDQETLLAWWRPFFRNQSQATQEHLRAKYNVTEDVLPKNGIRFLKAGQRTVSFGDMPLNAREGLLNESLHRRTINLNAVNGRSGSMVCTHRADGETVVYGIIAGAAGKIYNSMYTFTPEILEWVQHAVDSCAGPTNQKTYDARLFVLLEAKPMEDVEVTLFGATSANGSA